MQEQNLFYKIIYVIGLVVGYSLLFILFSPFILLLLLWLGGTLAVAAMWLALAFLIIYICAIFFNVFFHIPILLTVIILSIVTVAALLVTIFDDGDNLPACQTSGSSSLFPVLAALFLFNTFQNHN